MGAAQEIPVIANPSVVGFAEAVAYSPEVAADLRRRLGDIADGEPVDQVLEDLIPLMLAAVDVANSMHFRFDLSSLGGGEAPYALRSDIECSIAGLDGDHPNRKLIVVAPLAGSATVHLLSVGKERRFETGTLAMFPAFLANTVVPDGELVAVVAYADGPSFV